jgi:uncharacterized protein
MILEGLVTTLSADGTLNLAPMGPVVDRSLSWLQLRPFQTSQTFRNLKAHPCGVLHVTDDVELIARAALHGLTTDPETFPAVTIPGRVLRSTCRWYEFRVTDVDDHDQRALLHAEVVHVGHQRELFGFNRAMFAVLEATILATRLHLLTEADVREQLGRLRPLVEKTASDVEETGWQFVINYIDAHYRSLD